MSDSILDDPRLGQFSTQQDEGNGEGGGIADDPRLQQFSGRRVPQDLFGDPQYSRLQEVNEALQTASPREGIQLATEQKEIELELHDKYGVAPGVVRELTGGQQLQPERTQAESEESMEESAERFAKSVGAPLLFGFDVIEPIVTLPIQQTHRMTLPFIQAARERISEARFEQEMEEYRAGEREELPEPVYEPSVVPSIDWEGMFGPGMQENFISWSEVLTEAGMDPDATFEFKHSPFGVPLEEGEELPGTVRREFNTVQTLGLLGDIVVEPTMAGPLMSGMGRALRTAGARRAGDALWRAGQEAERALSPAGVARGARSAAHTVAPRVVEGTERRFASLINGMLNTQIPGTERLGHRTSIGELFLPYGRTDEMFNPGQRGVGALEGGAGRDEPFVISQRMGEVTVDDAIEQINSRLKDARTALGPTRYRAWLRGVRGALQQRNDVAARVSMYPQEVADQIQTLASEVVDNRGVVMSPELVEGLQDVPLRRAPLGESRDAFGRESVVASNLAEELRPLAEATPEAESVILQRNRERVRSLARRNGIDPDRAVEAFEYMTDKWTEADVILGYHMSQYEPIKQRFFEEVAKLGGDAGDAGELWSDAYAHAINGEDLSQFGSHLSASDEGAQLGRVFDSLGKQQLDIRAYFTALARGHLRRSYAVSQTQDSWQSYIRQVRNGGLINNRIVDTVMLEDRLSGLIPQGHQRLIQDYFENVSPSIPGERGFVVRQDNLVRHLRENGLSGEEAHDAVGALTRVANGEIEEATTGVEVTMRRREGAVQSRPAGGTTGRSISAAREELDLDALGDLGRLWDPNVALAEGARALRTQYPRQRFLADAHRIATRNNKVVAGAKAPHPKGWEFLAGEQYGPLNETWVHPWVKKEVDNALRSGEENLASSLNRIRSAITSSWLNAPTTIAANHAGSTMSAALMGINPAEQVVEVARVYDDVRKAGGLREIAEYQEMGDLILTGMGQDNIARTLRPSRVGPRVRAENWQSFLSEDIPRMWQDVNRAAPLSPVAGLDAFQLNENAHKIAAYRIILRRTGDPDQAYRAASQVVFDYQSMPKLLRVASDTGLAPFSAFPYFAFARSISSALRRPAAVGAFDRAANSIWNAQLPDEDVRHAVYAELDDWERNSRYVPLTERDPEGTFSMFPLGQMLPTNPLEDNPFVGSLEQLGVYRGIADGLGASANLGEALYGRQYGMRVTEPDVEAGTGRWASQVSAYLYASYAPAIARDVFTPAGASYDQNRGAVPAVGRLLRPAPGDGLTEDMESFRQVSEAELNNTAFETALSTFVRTTNPVSINPAFSDVLRGGGGSQGFENRALIEAKKQELREVRLDPSLTLEERNRETNRLAQEILQLNLQMGERQQDVATGSFKLLFGGE